MSNHYDNLHYPRPLSIAPGAFACRRSIVDDGQLDYKTKIPRRPDIDPTHWESPRSDDHKIKISGNDEDGYTVEWIPAPWYFSTSITGGTPRRYSLKRARKIARKMIDRQHQLDAKQARSAAMNHIEIVT